MPSLHEANKETSEMVSVPSDASESPQSGWKLPPQQEAIQSDLEKLASFINLSKRRGVGSTALAAQLLRVDDTDENSILSLSLPLGHQSGKGRCLVRNNNAQLKNKRILDLDPSSMDLECVKQDENSNTMPTAKYIRIQADCASGLPMISIFDECGQSQLACAYLAKDFKLDIDFKLWACNVHSNSEILHTESELRVYTCVCSLSTVLSNLFASLPSTMLPTMSSSMPSCLPTMSAMPTSLSTVSTSLPAMSTSLPAMSTSLPSVSTSLPSVSTSLPSVSTGLSAMSTSLSAMHTSLPSMPARLSTMSCTLSSSMSTSLSSARPNNAARFERVSFPRNRMDEESKPNSDDFDFWLTICALLTFLCYTLFGVLVFLLRRTINDAFRELLHIRTFKPSIENVFPLTNAAAITKLTHMETESSLNLSLSLRKGVSMFILRSVPLTAFHNAMLTPTIEFLQFLRDTATEEVSISSQDISVRANEERVNINEFRNSYDLIFAFFDEEALESETQDEQVVLSFYMVHVKQHQEERRPTQILYAYCKTNRDRLICIRKLFTNGSQNGDGDQKRWPDCAICLADAAADVIFVPCRHVAMCKKCLPSFQVSSKCLHCPLCRVLILRVNANLIINGGGLDSPLEVVSVVIVGPKRRCEMSEPEQKGG
ncbi:hypothetical protein TcWFU_004126 [Taenia crassiceps]|uniref:RING-type domain-containing protein n=1 Tax=Taenia crassiceps TaxID=6207 RepID=A0ABR4Q6B7_9CEST